MSQDRSTEGNAGRSAPSGNADYPWASFDSEAYFQHYYGEPHEDDDRLIRCAVEAIKRATHSGAGLDIVDVGTGPSLIPFFCGLPRARALTAWEYSECNINWLEAELRCRELRPQWRHFWNVVREAYGEDLPEDPVPALRAQARIERASIFELPERNWNAATMFFCAESITQRQDEFESACAAFARSVEEGGLLVAAFLAPSPAYIVAGTTFPVFNIDEALLSRIFLPNATALELQRIGTRKREIRSGYSGFIFLTGTAR